MRYRWYLQTFNIRNYSLSAMAAWFVARPHPRHAGIGNDALRLSLAGLAAASSSSRSTTSCSPSCCASRAASRSGTPACSIPSISRPTSCSQRSASRRTPSGSRIPGSIPFAIAPLVPDPPFTERAAAPGRGASGSEDRSLQCASLCGCARGGDRPRAPLRAPDVADHGRPRSAARHQQHVRPPCRRRSPEGNRRGLPRRSCATTTCPARFGGEEFSILLPETPPEQALEIAERIRRAVAERTFDVETSSEPIRATVSIGVAGFPKDGTDANELIHQADLAVYRAKLQGRNRVLGASSEPLLIPADRIDATDRGAGGRRPSRCLSPAPRRSSRRRSAVQTSRHPRPHAVHGPRFLSLDRRLSLTVGLVSTLGVGAGIVGLLLTWTTKDLLGLLTVLGLVGVGQALALEADEGSAVLSVSAVGCLAAASLFGFRAALPLALTSVAVEWSARRAAAAQRPLQHRRADARIAGGGERLQDRVLLPGRHGTSAGGLGARPARGRGYFAVNMGLVSLALALQGHERWWSVFRERFAWLLPHYLVYGFIGGVMALAYEAVQLLALAVFAVPLLLMRKTQEAYLKHTQRSAQKLRQAAETIQSQNVSLEHGEQAAEGALDGGDGVPVGDRRRARLVHRRPLAPRAATRAGDRPRARPLAGGARPARTRGALPRHRQARDPGRDPAEAGEPDAGRVVAHAAARGGGGTHHRPPRLPQRRRAGHPPPPRALRRHGLSGPAARARTSRSAPASSTSPTRSTRCSRRASTGPRGPPRRRCRSSDARPAPSSARAA